ncbi:MAG: MotA/TolQ/ExbB proton channel family protein [Nitrosomonas sp.]|nr:MAG: MotA/TolQ/ExbB proton channel family protein [Nitrosomonas sp.]
MEQGLGFSNFLAQLDGVGMTVLVLLISLSVASWYLIITKSIANFIAKRRAEAFLKHFWSVDSLTAVSAQFKSTAPDNAFAELAKMSIDAAVDAKTYNTNKLAAAGGMSEFVTRTLRNGIDQETAHVENGLTLIASVGSAAPYIGLFGTVWGIYHALIQIGLSGQGTLDKVAGPVGEALIMTALGLAVAIPAVLAYNAFARRNRIWIARLEAFAHDLFTLITIGDNRNQAEVPVSAVRSSQPAVDELNRVAIERGQ